MVLRGDLIRAANAQGEPIDEKLPVEPGHRLRLTVPGYDVPHLLAPIPDIPSEALPITLYAGPDTGPRSPCRADDQERIATPSRQYPMNAT